MNPQSPHSYQCRRTWKRFGILFNAKAAGNFVKWEDSFDRWKMAAKECQKCQEAKTLETIRAEDSTGKPNDYHLPGPKGKRVKLESKFERIKLHTWRAVS